MKSILILGVFLTLTNCNMISQDKINLNEFQELHKHNGSKNYEVVELFDNKMVINEKILVDKKNGNLFSQASQEDKLNKQEILKTKRITNLGDELDSLNDYYRILNDGTQYYSWYYSNWIINSDTTKHKYIDPFSNKKIDDPYEFTAKEKDPEKWLEKFKELYNKAQYVYEDSFYYFKIDEKWYLMDPYSKEIKNLSKNIKQQYPPKEDQDIRMVELQGLSPVFYFDPPEKLDTQLIKKIDYESTYYKEKKGLDSFQYSAGWWYLEIYMPLGDTLRIKRYSYFEDPELRLYKIPDAYDGRQDVLFIVQKPKNAHIEQVAGMYAIRPKDSKQPQRRYSQIVYKRDKEGYKIIDKEQSVESDEYKVWIKKKQK